MKQHFIKKIKLQGPISVAEYMADSMLAPEVGYYDSKISIGSRGDFITGPEISQMFGELIGVFFTQCWSINNNPKPIHFVDLGGGNGTMMNDSLRTIKKIEPNLFKNINPIFLESSKLLINNQKKLIPQSSFINDIDEIPNGNLFITANEFFDCLPIHQFIKVDGHWHERLIGLDKNNQMIFVISSYPSHYDFILPKNYKNGEIYELSSTLVQIVNGLSKKINEFGGIALIIDYAYEDKEPFGTLQSVKNHKYINPLLKPANSDLSCKVNFKLLSTIARDAGLAVKGPITQKVFFEKLGIDLRSAQLIKKNPEKKKKINEEKNRLIDDEGMGNLFKVLAITKNNYSIPEIF